MLNQMLNHMARYFTAEKQESLLFVLVGLAAMAAAVWLWRRAHRLRAMAFPLVAVALIQLVVGSTVYLRTDGQLQQLSAQLQAAPAAFKADETQRMRVVMDNFRLYRTIEMALLALGLLLVALGRRRDPVLGVGLGLALQSGFMLALDFFAEARGADYLAALQALPV